jgi:hypothetical protein
MIISCKPFEKHEDMEGRAAARPDYYDAPDPAFFQL